MTAHFANVLNRKCEISFYRVDSFATNAYSRRISSLGFLITIEPSCAIISRKRPPSKSDRLSKALKFPQRKSVQLEPRVSDRDHFLDNRFRIFHFFSFYKRPIKKCDFIRLETTKFVSVSFFSPIKTIYLRVSTKPQPNAAKSPLPVDVRRSKTLLLKLPSSIQGIQCEKGTLLC